MSRCAAKIYLLDGENVPFPVGEGKYHGKSITHSTSFPNIVQTLESFESFVPRDDDIWILSYPKSGTHWIFEILGILLTGKLEPLEQYKIAAMVELKKNIADIPMMYGRRIFNTHLKKQFLPKGVLNTSKVICIARNPKSVAVSFYRMTTSSMNTPYDGTINGYLPLFLNGYSDVYGSWFEHVAEYWHESRNNNNIMFLFYEELTKEQGKNIHQLSNFLGLDHSESFCDGVAKVASKENMRNESGKSAEQKQLYKEMFRDGKNKIVGEGKLDGWKNILTVAQNEMFDQIYEETMKEHPDLKDRIHIS